MHRERPNMIARAAVLGGFVMTCCLWSFGQDGSENYLLVRRYRDGETLTYHMKGVDDGVRYEIQARGIVKRNSQGHYIEEYAWSNQFRDATPVTLPQAVLEFRQILSLDPETTPYIPNLAPVARIIGPIT